MADHSTTSTHSFRDVTMPERFVLQVLDAAGEWLDECLLDAADFGRNEDGTYVCSTAGSPIFLRCTRQDGRVVYVTDGAGEPFVYRLEEANTPALSRPVENAPLCAG